MIRFIWNYERDSFLKKNYELLGPDGCGEALGANRRAVIDRACVLGVKYKRPPPPPRSAARTVRTNAGPLSPAPFQDYADDHRAWQNTPVPVYVTGNLCARLAA